MTVLVLPEPSSARTFTGMIFAPGATPVTPIRLAAAAAAPLMAVPWP